MSALRFAPRRGDEGFTGPVALAVAVPMLLVLFVTCAAVGGAAYGGLRARTAAEAGADALARGEDAESAVLGSLSRRLATTAQVRVEPGGRVVVRVAPLPGAIPGPRFLEATAGPTTGEQP